LGIVIRVDKFVAAFFVPFWIGIGKFLYPFAIGLIIALSNPWLNEKVALLSFSKQSFISLGLSLFKANSPSDPAYALNTNEKIQITVIINFFILISL
jgi:hypothetical protein